MLKKLFEFLCLINGVSAGGDFTETKWKHKKQPSQAARPTEAPSAPRESPESQAPGSSPRGKMNP